jgi:hypothetical protein
MNRIDAEIMDIMGRYASLPMHIAKKHLVAAMRRSLKDGIPILKAKTPVDTSKRFQGRDKRGHFKKSTGRKAGQARGALRRAVIAKAKFIGRNADGCVVGTLGYRAPLDSRKAIWLVYGTRRGIEPRTFVQEAMDQIRPQALSKLKAEMVAAFDAAVREKSSGQNPGWNGVPRGSK